MCCVSVLRSRPLFFVCGLCSDIRTDICTEAWYLLWYLHQRIWYIRTRDWNLHHKTKSFLDYFCFKPFHLDNFCNINSQISCFGATISANIGAKAIDREQTSRTQNRDTSYFHTSHKWISSAWHLSLPTIFISDFVCDGSRYVMVFIRVPTNLILNWVLKKSQIGLKKKTHKT